MGKGLAVGRGGVGVDGLGTIRRLTVAVGVGLGVVVGVGAKVGVDVAVGLAGGTCWGVSSSLTCPQLSDSSIPKKTKSTNFVT